VKGKGCFRQSWLKVGEGKAYRVLLPWYAVRILRRRWDESGRPKEGLILVNRNGNVKNPNNFNRTFQAARGSEFAHINLKAYRKTVATATERKKGIGAAGLQLNHAVGSRVTGQHYVEKLRDVPDNRDVLNAYVA
jgi:integrase